METDAQPTQPKPKRRWDQYSLRTLMIVVTLFAIACSWFAVKMGQARRQREAVEALSKLKGSPIICNLSYDYQQDSPNAKAPGPAWLRNLLGIDFFCNVSTVWFTGKITDADLVHFKDFPKLRVLCFNEIMKFDNPQVTDEGLKIVQGLTQLEALGLCNTRITDAGMERIGKLVHLKVLGLQNVGITDIGLKHVKNLSQLQTLRLANTKITDAGLENLKELSNLQFLDLESTRITDVGLTHLNGLHALQEIRLGNTKVGDDGVKNLQKALPKLKIQLYEVREL
jgi:internalin A